MAKNCGKCVKSIRGLEFAKCSGYCEQMFHFACCGLTRPNYELIVGQALWLCEVCRSTVNNRPLSELLSDNEVITQLESLKLEVADMKEKLATLSDTISDCTENVKCTFNQFEEKINLRDNRLDGAIEEKVRDSVRDAIPQSQFSGRARLVDRVEYSGSEEGTGDVELTDLSVSNLVPATESALFWLYLSGLNPQVSADDISKVVRSCLQTEDDVKSIKLVPKNVDLTRLTFVSFKVGLPLTLKEVALRASTWPKGIRFREFENVPARDRRGDNSTM